MNEIPLNKEIEKFKLHLENNPRVIVYRVPILYGFTRAISKKAGNDGCDIQSCH